MRPRLFVSNLPFSSTEDDLRWLFEQNGHRLYDATIVRRPEDGRSRGFAFIEVSDALAAANAIRTMSGAMLGERAIRVEPATPRRTRVAE